MGKETVEQSIFSAISRWSNASRSAGGCNKTCKLVGKDEDVHIPSASKLRVNFSNRCCTTDDCSMLQVMAGKRSLLSSQ